MRGYCGTTSSINSGFDRILLWDGKFGVLSWVVNFFYASVRCSKLISTLRFAMLVFMLGTGDVVWRSRSCCERKAETRAFYIPPWLSIESLSSANHPVPIIAHVRFRCELFAT